MDSIKGTKLLAVDPSLTASGWALFELRQERPCAVGVVSPPGPGESMEKRLGSLQRTVNVLFEMLSLGRGDFVVCEGPAPLVVNPESSLKVERVRGIFEAVARSIGVSVPGRINPRTVQTELLGMRGKQISRKEVKEWARMTARRLWGASLDELDIYRGTSPMKKARLTQDMIDALLIGFLVTARLNLCDMSGSDISTAFAPRARGKYSGSRASFTLSEFRVLREN